MRAFRNEEKEVKSSIKAKRSISLTSKFREREETGELVVNSLAVFENQSANFALVKFPKRVTAPSFT